MIDPRRSRRGRFAFVTAGFVSLAAAAAVGWAAATPVGTTASTASAPIGSTTQTAQQLAAARANVTQVRGDLARILAGEDDLPRASIANLPAVQIPTVQVPTASAPGTVQAAPIITHTTTGASGVVRP